MSNTQLLHWLTKRINKLSQRYEEHKAGKRLLSTVSTGSKKTGYIEVLAYIKKHFPETHVGETAQVFPRWVKASKRLPDKSDVYYCKVDIDRWSDGKEIVKGKDEVRFSDGKWYNDFYNWKVVEWLEETDAPAAQVAEDAEAGGVIEILCHTLEELQSMYSADWPDYVDEQVTNAIALAKNWEAKDRTESITQRNRLKREKAREAGFDDFCEACQIPYKEECPECAKLVQQPIETPAPGEYFRKSLQCSHCGAMHYRDAEGDLPSNCRNCQNPLIWPPKMHEQPAQQGEVPEEVMAWIKAEAPTAINVLWNQWKPSDGRSKYDGAIKAWTAGANAMYHRDQEEIAQLKAQIAEARRDAEIFKDLYNKTQQ